MGNTTRQAALARPSDRTCMHTAAYAHNNTSAALPLGHHSPCASLDAVVPPHSLHLLACHGVLNLKHCTGGLPGSYLVPLAPTNQGIGSPQRQPILCRELFSLSHAVGFITGVLHCFAAAMAGLQGVSRMHSHWGLKHAAPHSCDSLFYLRSQHGESRTLRLCTRERW